MNTRTTLGLQPPVQGAQIAACVSRIRLIALNTTLTQDERLTLMKCAKHAALDMLEAYYLHFENRTKQLP